jgi:hypothetical protein
MKRNYINTFLTICLLFTTNSAFAGLLYTYNQLTVMELDQISKLVQDKIKESKKADARIVPLKEAIQAVFSRPDQDRMIEKVAGPLRSELIDLGQYEKAMTELTEEALNALKNTRNFKPAVQVTYIFFLENLMADLKPVLKTGESFEKKLLKKIEKADISITKQAQNDLGVRGFSEKKSPSDTAELILEELKKKEETEKAAPAGVVPAIPDPAAVEPEKKN